MNYKVAVCDDEQNVCTSIKKYVDRFSFEYNLGIICDIYISGEGLLEYYKNRQSYDIIFMDIELLNQNGIEVATHIRKLDNNTKVIFVSNYPEYMQESFLAHPYFFIQKPIRESSISNILDEVLNDISENSTYYSIIDIEGSPVNLHLYEIYYIESIDSKKQMLAIHTTDKTYSIKGTIHEWFDKLNKYNFIDCHRGLLVNLEHIHVINSKEITLRNGIKLPISRDKENIIRKRYINQIVRKH